MSTSIFRITRQQFVSLVIATFVLPLATVLAQDKQETPKTKPEPAKTERRPKPEEFKPEQQAARERSPSAAMSLTTTHSPARSSCIPRTGTTFRRTPTKTRRTSLPKPVCSTWPISSPTIKARRVRSLSSSTAGPAPRPYGCTWALSGRSVWSPPTTPTPRRALFRGQQRIQPARRERSRVRGRARHRLQPHRRQGQGESILWRRPGCAGLRRIHRSNSSPSMDAGIRPSICSAKATARRAPLSWSTFSKPNATSTSTA